MDVHDAYISDEDFATCLQHMPQPCVDLVVEHDGGILLARRQNEPAKGEWFWPGGRLYKGERLDDAPARIASEELGLGVETVDRLGVSEHFWETTSADSVETRHTIPVVYHVRPDPQDQSLALDAQHDEVRILRKPGPTCHEYVREYIDQFDLFDRING